MSQEPRASYSVAEASQITGVPTRTIYYYIEHGKIPVVKVGRRVMIRREWIAQFTEPRPLED